MYKQTWLSYRPEVAVQCDWKQKQDSFSNPVFSLEIISWIMNDYWIYFVEFCEKIAKFQYNTNICSVMHCTMKNFISKLLQEKIIFIPFRNEEFFFTNDEKQFSSSFFWNSFPLCAAVYAAARKVGDGLVYGNIVTNSETLWLPSRCLLYHNKVGEYHNNTSSYISQ